MHFNYRMLRWRRAARSLYIEILTANLHAQVSSSTNPAKSLSSTASAAAPFVELPGKSDRCCDKRDCSKCNCATKQSHLVVGLVLRLVLVTDILRRAHCLDSAISADNTVVRQKFHCNGKGGIIIGKKWQSGGTDSQLFA